MKQMRRARPSSKTADRNPQSTVALAITVVFVLVSVVAAGNTSKPHEKPKPPSVTGNGASDYASFLEAVIVVKTPGKCMYSADSVFANTYTLAGEHQDFVLGKLVQEKLNLTGFLYNKVLSEKSVYALGTNDQCHSSSLQNFCRGLFSQIKESAVEPNIKEDVFLPPGVNKSYFEDKTTHKSAVPFSFWPVAIRMDHLERFLYENVSIGCPPLAKDIEEENQLGLLSLLASQQSIQEKFAAFVKDLAPIFYHLQETLKFENMEQIFREITLKSLDNVPVYNTLMDFYNLVMYAKYGNSQSLEIRANLVKPVMHLITEKLNWSEDSERDKVSIFSVSDKLMAALNSFLFGYSHECYLERIMNGEKSDKNFCLGQLKASSNLVLKVSVDNQRLERVINAYRNGLEISLCGFGDAAACPVNKYEQLVKQKLKGVTQMECHPKIVLEITDPVDAVMVYVVIGLFFIFIFYLARCSWYMIANRDLDIATIAAAIPNAAVGSTYEPTTGLEMSARPSLYDTDEPESSSLKKNTSRQNTL